VPLSGSMPLLAEQAAHPVELAVHALVLGDDGLDVDPGRPLLLHGVGEARIRAVADHLLRGGPNRAGTMWCPA
jgi:hypothetical protein